MAAASYPRLLSTQTGRHRGRPRSPCQGGIGSTRVMASCELFRLAPVKRRASGTPCPSQMSLALALGAVGRVRAGQHPAVCRTPWGGSLKVVDDEHAVHCNTDQILICETDRRRLLPNMRAAAAELRWRLSHSGARGQGSTIGVGSRFSGLKSRFEGGGPGNRELEPADQLVASAGHTEACGLSTTSGSGNLN
jgi:hypothetical protein